MMSESSGDSRESAPGLHRKDLSSIVRALCGIRFGSVEVVVHDGRIVQIERKEKFRLADTRKKTEERD